MSVRGPEENAIESGMVQLFGIPGFRFAVSGLRTLMDAVGAELTAH